MQEQEGAISPEENELSNVEKEALEAINDAKERLDQVAQRIKNHELDEREAAGTKRILDSLIRNPQDF